MVYMNTFLYVILLCLCYIHVQVLLLDILQCYVQSYSFATSVAFFFLHPITCLPTFAAPLRSFPIS